MRLDKKECKDCQKKKFDSRYSRDFGVILCDICFNKRYRILNLFNLKPTASK